MRKFMRALLLFLIAIPLVLTSCGSWDNLLTIDGKAVPFTKGEQEVSETLGELFVRFDQYEYSSDGDKEKAVLRLCSFETEDAGSEFEYTFYDFNNDYCDMSKHDISFLGYEGIDIPIDKLEKDYEGYIVHDGVSDYTLYYADGDFVEFENDDYYSEENESIFEKLQSRTLSGDSDGFVMISLFKSEDNKTEDISFTVVTRKK